MKNFSVKLVSTTKTEIEFIQSFIENDEFKEIISTPEGLMVYAARVSSPNQENPKYANLLKYCLKNGHWSVFEMCDMMVEIETSRALAAQILRHKTFNFQEFSQRYQALTEEGICIYEARRQDQKNRQNSIDDISAKLEMLADDTKYRTFAEAFRAISFKNTWNDVAREHLEVFNTVMKEKL